ncbi:hypothetical protein [Streptomyces sp. NPDC001268]|uniref:hypothetical protein n=1 Tax=Streptomyces sp. NPDC001268 TaxID=3364553 RepID=UPI0036972563
MASVHHARLAAVAADAARTLPTDPHRPARSNEPISLTVPEIRHLLTAVFSPPAVTAARVLQWPIWRRRHQATVRRSHYRRRSADETAEAPDGIGVTGPGPDRARTRRALEAFGPRIEGPAG